MTLLLDEAIGRSMFKSALTVLFSTILELLLDEHSSPATASIPPFTANEGRTGDDGGGGASDRAYGVVASSKTVAGDACGCCC